MGISGFVTGAQVFDHLVGVEHIGAYVRAPLYSLLLALELGLLLLTLLEFYVIEAGLEDAQCILPVILLASGLGILYGDPTLCRKG